MRILIDIGHPGHVHLFRNMILAMQAKGHEFFITARDKEVSQELLRFYGLKFHSRGKGYKGLFGKALGMLEITWRIVRHAKRFKPDILIGGVGNLYIALAGWLVRKPSLIFDDTEHATLELAFVKRFATCILTPDIYLKDLGPKQLRYPGYHEWAYLHKRYFTPDPGIRKKLGVGAGEKYVLVRFVSWSAGHDVGSKGLTNEDKIKLIGFLSGFAKVFISSEGSLPLSLQSYKMQVHPAEMHSVLSEASLFVGEGATMASEAVCVGTPAIYVNPLLLGYCEEQVKYGLMFHELEMGKVMKVAEEILTGNRDRDFSENHQKLFNNKIDITAFMEWFIENYPSSLEAMRNDPGVQNKFLSTAK